MYPVRLEQQQRRKQEVGACYLIPSYHAVLGRTGSCVHVYPAALRSGPVAVQQHALYEKQRDPGLAAFFWYARLKNKVIFFRSVGTAGASRSVECTTENVNRRASSAIIRRA